MHLPACLLSSPLALCGRGGESASAALQHGQGEKKVSGLDVRLTVTLLKRHKYGRRGGKGDGWEYGNKWVREKRRVGGTNARTAGRIEMENREEKWQ